MKSKEEKLTWKEKRMIKKFVKVSSKAIKKAQKEGRNIFADRKEAEEALLKLGDEILNITLDTEQDGRFEGEQLSKENIKHLSNEELDQLLEDSVKEAKKYV